MLTKLRNNGMEISAYINDTMMSYSYVLNLKEENDRLMRINTELISRVLNTETTALDERTRQKILADTTLKASKFIMARVVYRKFMEFKKR